MKKKLIVLRNIFTLMLLMLANNSQSAVDAINPDGDFISSGKQKINDKFLLAKMANQVNEKKLIEYLSKFGISVDEKFSHISQLVSLRIPHLNIPLNNNMRVERITKFKNDLQRSGYFQYVELDYVEESLGNVSDIAYLDGSLWGLKNFGQNGGKEDADIDAELAWNITSGTPETIVAVIDTGVRITHNDLSKNIWINRDEIPNNGVDDDQDGFVDNYNGIDSRNGDGFPEDTDGHGTHCSGTIAASGNDDFPHVGVAYNVTILPVKASNGGSFPHSAIIKGINFLIQEGVTIANCSYGGYSPSQAAFDAYKAGGENGIIFVCAAGNDANDNDRQKSYPDSYELENIISVAASDRNDQLADFSNYGKAMVDLAAPGAGIYSSVSTNDKAYEDYSGTSMAAPHVTGVVALMRSLSPDWSILQIREKLFESIDSVDVLSSKVATGGRINAFKAVQGMGSVGQSDGIMEYSIVPAPDSLLEAGKEMQIEVTVIDGEPVENAVVTMLLEDGNTAFFSNDGIDPDLKEGDNVYTSFFKVPDRAEKLRITLFVSAEGKSDSIKVFNYNIAAVPENDDFKFAEKIPEQNTTISSYNTFATTEDNEPRHTGDSKQFSSLWWKWTPELNGKVYFDTSGSDFDVNLAIYRGSAIDELILEAKNPNSNVFEREPGAYLNAKKGETYRICISSATESDNGYIRLRIARGGAPDINKPVLASVLPFNGFISNTNRIQISGISIDPNPNASGIKEVNVRSNNGLFVSAVGKEEWYIPISLTEGENRVEVVAIDYSNNISDAAIFQYDYYPPDLTNDHFVNAEDLNREYLKGYKGQKIIKLNQALPKDLKGVDIYVNGKLLNANEYIINPEETAVVELINPLEADSELLIFNPFWITETITTEKASKEFGEPEHAGNAGGASVWYKFKAPYDGKITIDILESGFDTLMGMYIGKTLNTLKEITSNDDAFKDIDLEFDPGISQLSQSLEKGQQVYIAIDGYGGDKGGVAVRTFFHKSDIHRLYINLNGDGEIVSPYQPFADKYGNYSLHKNGDIVEVKAEPLKGKDFFGWSGSLNLFDKNFRLPITEDFSITANFISKSGIFSFENGQNMDFRWYGSGSKQWYRDDENSFDGEYSMSAGKISDLETSSLIFSGIFDKGNVSFALKTLTEKDWDKFQFYIDDIKVGEWSGEIEWKIVEFPINKGPHVLRWVYEKDFANSIPGEFISIDSVKLPLSINASLKLTTGEDMKIKIKGAAHHNYELWVTDNLIDWKFEDMIRTDNNGEGMLPVNGDSIQKFYKIKLK